MALIPILQIKYFTKGNIMADSNKDLEKSIKDSVDAETVAKANRRGMSVTEILDRERGDWLQRHRGVVVKKQSKLGHPHVHKIYERYFEKMSQYLFFIPVLGRVLVAEKNHRDVVAIESAIIKSMQESIKIFDERIGQYKAAIEAHEIADGNYNKSYAVEISYTSPLDKLYYQVLEKADMCMLLNYNLWVENALNPDYQKNEIHRTENEWEVKRLIKNVNYQIIMNYRRLLNSINRDQRAARTGSSSETPSPSVEKAADTQSNKPTKKVKSSTSQVAEAAIA